MSETSIDTCRECGVRKEIQHEGEGICGACWAVAGSFTGPIYSRLRRKGLKPAVIEKRAAEQLEALGRTPAGFKITRGPLAHLFTCPNKKPLEWESIAGCVLVFRIVDGHKRYSWRCPTCGMTGTAPTPRDVVTHRPT